MVIINNKSYIGKSISINNNKIIVDGIDVTPESKEINIQVNGNIENLSVDYCNQINVVGDVENIKSTSGNVNCKNVKNSIQTTSGDVECEGDCNGNILTTSGKVKANKIFGNVSTISGNIKNSS